MRAGVVVGVILLAVAVYLAPVPFDAEIGPWEIQPDPPRVGLLAPNTLLNVNTRLGSVGGPESVTVGPDGRLYASSADGWVVAVDRHSGATEQWVNVGGRPLGLEFDQAGDLIVADGVKGLLHVNATTKRITILAHEAGGRSIRFADDVALAHDEEGSVYFSDATTLPPTQSGCTHDVFQTSLVDVLSGLPRGRLLRYSPRTGTAQVLLEGLHFANGVALAHDGTYVLVNETPRSRVVRYWLAGPKKGSSEVFAEGLPGLPDGISRRTDGSGHFWVALVGARDPLMDTIAPFEAVRTLVLKLGLHRFVPIKLYGHVIELDGEGRIVRSLEGSTPGITSVTEVDGTLYFGHLHADHITAFSLAPSSPP